MPICNLKKQSGRKILVLFPFLPLQHDVKNNFVSFEVSLLKDQIGLTNITIDT